MRGRNEERGKEEREKKIGRLGINVMRRLVKKGREEWRKARRKKCREGKKNKEKKEKKRM